MPTQTDPHLPAVDSPTAAMRAVLADPPSPPLTADPGPVVEAWRRPVSDLAAQLHRGPEGGPGCDCEYPGDIDGHGVDFEEWAGQVRGGVWTEGLIEQEPQAPVKSPIEAKVAAGSLAGTIMTVVAAVAALIGSQLEVFKPLLGNSPWIGPLTLLVGVAVNAAQTGAAYQAPHTPRTTP